MSHAHVCEIAEMQRKQSVPTRRPRVEGGERLKGDRSTAARSRPVPHANRSRFVERTVPPMVSYSLCRNRRIENNSVERRQDAGSIVSCGRADSMNLGTTELTNDSWC